MVQAYYQQFPCKVHVINQPEGVKDGPVPVPPAPPPPAPVVQYPLGKGK